MKQSDYFFNFSISNDALKLFNTISINKFKFNSILLMIHKDYKFVFSNFVYTYLLLLQIILILFIY